MRARSAAILVGVGLAGCGGGSGAGGDERAATAVAQRWLHAMAERDDATACASLTTRLQKLIDLQLRQLGHGPNFNCRRFAARWVFAPSPVGRTDARIERVRVHERTATVELAAPGGLETELTMRKQGGRWRIDNYR